MGKAASKGPNVLGIGNPGVLLTFEGFFLSVLWAASLEIDRENLTLGTTS
jgi:hypothetical protein